MKYFGIEPRNRNWSVLNCFLANCFCSEICDILPYSSNWVNMYDQYSAFYTHCCPSVAQWSERSPFTSASSILQQVRFSRDSLPPARKLLTGWVGINTDREVRPRLHETGTKSTWDDLVSVIVLSPNQRREAPFRA